MASREWLSFVTDIAMRRLRRLAFVVVLLCIATGCVRIVSHPCKPETESSPSSIDLVELIELFYGEKTPLGSAHFWSTGAMPGSPIEWETEGVGSCFDDDCRVGSVVATILGDPTHRTLKQYLVPGRWKITMLGANAGFSEVQFEPDDTMHSDRVWEMVSYVADRIPLVPHKCTEPNAEGWYSSVAIFRIQRDDIPPAWLAFSNGSGSSGHSIKMTLYTIKHKADSFECWHESVGAHLWPPTFRARWETSP